MSKSIYPSIPSPGNDAASMRATLDAIRQALTMVIINAQKPSANYTPSSAAQVFVTTAQLKAATANFVTKTTKTTVVSRNPVSGNNITYGINRQGELQLLG